MTLINLEYVQNLIDNEMKESLTLDYKKELNKNNEIAKDISSFANTNGGKIIYGIDEVDGLPNSINWIKSKNVKEKIESIILDNIQPEIRGYGIFEVKNPDNPIQALFIVDIPESIDAPHMVNHRYYIRRNFESEPMEDFEVKNAIFRKGLRKALEFEVTQNLEMTRKMRTSLGKYSNSRNRTSLLLVPFYTEAWRAIVSSGILFIIKDRADTLVKAYSIIHEINYLIDSIRFEKYEGEKGVFTQIHDSKPEHGTWIPAIIIDKIPKLEQILQEIKFD